MKINVNVSRQLLSIFGMAVYLTCLTSSGYALASEKPKELLYTITCSGHWEAHQREGILTCTSPQEGTSDRYRENVNVVVQDHADTRMSLKQFSQMTIQNSKEVIKGYTLLKSGPTEVGDIPAFQVIFTASPTPQGFRLKRKQVYIIEGNKAFVVTFTAEEDKFDKYIGAADRIINSFKLL